ncbi:hypothetical protein [Streptomyces hirsutus]|uniref:hypothetical protein n=1 Tax=Streptomyces hirsutus TaxID=35620 RepID=UPI003681AB56
MKGENRHRPAGDRAAEEIRQQEDEILGSRSQYRPVRLRPVASPQLIDAVTADGIHTGPDSVVTRAVRHGISGFPGSRATGGIPGDREV